MAWENSSSKNKGLNNLLNRTFNCGFLLWRTYLQFANPYFRICIFLQKLIMEMMRYSSKFFSLLLALPLSSCILFPSPPHEKIRVKMCCLRSYLNAFSFYFLTFFFFFYGRKSRERKMDSIQKFRLKN